MRDARLALRGLVAAGAILAAAPAFADPYVHVIAAGAAVRSGPGGSYRTVGLARAGESLPVLERDPLRRWYRVRLEDGSTGWILGEEVDPYELGEPSGFGERVSRILGRALAPGDASLPGEISAGGGMAWIKDLGRTTPELHGIFGARAAVSVEGRFAVAISFAQANLPAGALLYYSAEAAVPLWPDWYITPELVAGGGLLQRLPNAGAHLLSPGFAPMLAGGGALKIHVRRAATLRLDYRTLLTFDSSSADGALAPTATLSLALSF